MTFQIYFYFFLDSFCINQASTDLVCVFLSWLLFFSQSLGFLSFHRRNCFLSSGSNSMLFISKSTVLSSTSHFSPASKTPFLKYPTVVSNPTYQNVNWSPSYPNLYLYPFSTFLSVIEQFFSVYKIKALGLCLILSHFSHSAHLLENSPLFILTIPTWPHFTFQELLHFFIHFYN